MCCILQTGSAHITTVLETYTSSHQKDDSQERRGCQGILFWEGALSFEHVFLSQNPRISERRRSRASRDSCRGLMFCCPKHSGHPALKLALKLRGVTAELQTSCRLLLTAVLSSHTGRTRSTQGFRSRIMASSESDGDSNPR